MRLDRLCILAALALVVAQAVLPASSAQAQCDPTTTTCNRVGADGKGILGGGILGAEIGFMTNALIVNAGVRELDEWWAWILFPTLGATGGAVAGYFALEEPVQMDAMGRPTRGFPEAAVAVFAISMALIVPTFVGVLALTAYNPGPDTGGGGATGGEDDEAGDDGGDGDQENSAEPDAGAQSAMQRVLAGGPGLLRFDHGRLLLGLPMVSAADTYTAEERAHMRLPFSADLLVPVVSGTF